MNGATLVITVNINSQKNFWLTIITNFEFSFKQSLHASNSRRIPTSQNVIDPDACIHSTEISCALVQSQIRRTHHKATFSTSKEAMQMPIKILGRLTKTIDQL